MLMVARGQAIEEEEAERAEEETLRRWVGWCRVGWGGGWREGQGGD